MSAHSEAAIEAFLGLLDFAGETVTIDGTEYTGKVSELTRDELFAEGGMDDGGGYRIMLKLSDFPADPDEFVDVIARSRTCQIVDPVIRNNGHLEIVCQRVIGASGQMLTTEGAGELTTEGGQELETEGQP